MIPKVISFYWGGGPLSYLQHLSVVSFKKHNPDWGVTLFMPKSTKLVGPTWDTNELIHPYTGKDYLEETKELCNVEIVDFAEFNLGDHIHEVPRGDFLMWYMLYERGGAWADIDILFISPIDKLLEQDFDAMICWNDFPSVGFFVAKPKQRIYEDMHEEAKAVVQRGMSHAYQSTGAYVLSNRFRNFEELQTAYNDLKILNLPMDIVYPYLPNSDIYEMFFGEIDKTTENTIGLHWYNGSFVSKEYNNNFELYRNNGSPMSKRIAECSV